jgi:hypothetical protein
MQGIQSSVYRQVQSMLAQRKATLLRVLRAQYCCISQVMQNVDFIKYKYYNIV